MLVILPLTAQKCSMEAVRSGQYCRFLDEELEGGRQPIESFAGTKVLHKRMDLNHLNTCKSLTLNELPKLQLGELLVQPEATTCSYCALRTSLDPSYEQGTVCTRLDGASPRAESAHLGSQPFTRCAGRWESGFVVGSPSFAANVNGMIWVCPSVIPAAAHSE